MKPRLMRLALMKTYQPDINSLKAYMLERRRLLAAALDTEPAGNDDGNSIKE